MSGLVVPGIWLLIILINFATYFALRLPNPANETRRKANMRGTLTIVVVGLLVVMDMTAVFVTLTIILKI